MMETISISTSSASPMKDFSGTAAKPDLGPTSFSGTLSNARAAKTDDAATTSNSSTRPQEAEHDADTQATGRPQGNDSSTQSSLPQATRPNGTGATDVPESKRSVSQSERFRSCTSDSSKRNPSSKTALAANPQSLMGLITVSAPIIPVPPELTCQGGSSPFQSGKTAVAGTVSSACSIDAAAGVASLGGNSAGVDSGSAALQPDASATAVPSVAPPDHGGAAGGSAAPTTADGTTPQDEGKENGEGGRAAVPEAVASQPSSSGIAIPRPAALPNITSATPGNQDISRGTAGSPANSFASPSSTNVLARAFHAAVSEASSLAQVVLPTVQSGAAKSPSAPQTAPAVVSSASQFSGLGQDSSGTSSNGHASADHSNDGSAKAPQGVQSASQVSTNPPAPRFATAQQSATTAAVAASAGGTASVQSDRPVSAGNGPANVASSSLPQSGNSLSTNSVPGSSVSTTQVSQAQVFDRSSGSEMRIALQTDTLGSIELLATSDKDRIGAAIAAAKPETMELLTNDLPALHQALADRNLQVQQINISHGSLDASMSGRGGAFSRGGNAWQEQKPVRHWHDGEDASPVRDDLPNPALATAADGRLSVRA
jgi:Flagellar hook-length control protein FliK